MVGAGNHLVKLSSNFNSHFTIRLGENNNGTGAVDFEFAVGLNDNSELEKQYIYKSCSITFTAIVSTL